MVIKQKGHVLGIVFAILLFGVLNFTNKPVEGGEISTYEHPRTGYTVKYPAAWKLVTHNKSRNELFSLYDPIAQKQDKRMMHLNQGSKIEISSRDYTSEKNLKEYLEDKSQYLPDGEKVIKITEISLSGISAIKREISFANGRSFNTTFLGPENKIYNVEMFIYGYDSISGNKRNNYGVIYDQILTSFKLKASEVK
ncbi:MAG TPA: hypothetical protein VEC17_03515 [Candidatus Binatia bacterium]|nr:hypothetical protein [Candidatus Binatia bacterium]